MLLEFLLNRRAISHQLKDAAKRQRWKEQEAGRNRLAHGFPLPEAAQQASRLQELLEDLTNAWRPNSWQPLREVAQHLL